MIVGLTTPQPVTLRLRQQDGSPSAPLSQRPLSSYEGGTEIACVLPETLDPGLYDLEIDAPGEDALNAGAVWVYAAFPKYYTVVHVHAPRTAADDASRAQWTAVADAVVREEAAFVLCTGPLTASGSESDFRQLATITENFPAPVFLSPSPEDANAYRAWFGPATYGFQYGLDAYVAWDTSWTDFAQPAYPAHATLYRTLRAHVAARWITAFTPDYAPHTDPRSQLLLFVDRRTDFLVTGHATDAEAVQARWGDTTIRSAPPMPERGIRIVDVTAKGLIPRVSPKPADDEGARE